MKIERDETKTEKLSLKLRAYQDAAAKDVQCFNSSANVSEEEMALFRLAKDIYADAEKLEAVGVDHTTAVLLAMMNLRRRNAWER